MLANVIATLVQGPWRELRQRRAARSLSRGASLHRAGNDGGAYREYARALALEPDSAEAHYGLGVIEVQSSRIDCGVAHLRQALSLKPEFVEAHVALGNAFKLAGDGTRAIASYRAALELEPDLVAGHYNLGLVLKNFGRWDEAAVHFGRTLALAPDFLEAIQERTLCLVNLGRFDEADELVAGAVRRHPESGDLHACQGFVWQKLHRPREALQCYETARRLGCSDRNFDNNLGIVLQDLGRVDEAIMAYDRAIELQAGARTAALPRYHRALAHLLLGDYATGWGDYELRLISEDRPRCEGDYPRWQGNPLSGCTLLVRAEQGLGDEIMFASCLPDVIERARHCIVECSPRLEKLYRRSFPRAEVIAVTLDRALPAAVAHRAVDFEIPVASLPQQLRRTLEEFPRHSGYLSPDMQRVAHWRERLSRLGSGPAIGISWRGGTHTTRSPLRSVPLERWLPILTTRGAKFVSLQYSDAVSALSELEARAGIHVEHWQEAIDDYDETAALVCALDVVISVCTAVVHLGGALGVPVWVMAPYSPEWRYGFAGERMPWYPSVRLFRQPAFGEWKPVIDGVATRLADYVASYHGEGQTAHDL